MGKNGKNTRKGKKAWRKLSTDDIDDFHEQSTKDALSGGSLASAPSETLFYLDKSTDVPVKRKIEKNREKVLRHESILRKNLFVKAVPSSTMKKSKKMKKSGITKETAEKALKKNEEAGADSGMVDIWEDRGDNDKNRKKVKLPVIPAVEVEPPGCSFNPERESHKDSLARAVADEMRKIYQSELGPQPIPLTVPGEAIDEEARYFIEADDASEDEMDDQNTIESGDITLEKRSTKSKRVTRVDLNRRVRWKEHLRAETESKKIEKLFKEIDSISDIIQEIAEEDKEKEKRHLRRIVAKQERLKSRPPRLGKRKFEPAPLQVLLSEEITGSLRKLKGCCTLARDRFKSLEKRGLIVPSAKGSRK
ncbi:hypothetical protein Nepgr_032368 [Nepenthes gracilis]|uniref:Ribosome biogenesis protein NOP53 n=1 Tax=Nepenthes gracilis TaxID=150966 RepID=A0AAD3Y7M0_NEPGR|nr:hypothetical protein Nepgr_032368 [Nepenthes gracilis]